MYYNSVVVVLISTLLTSTEKYNKTDFCYLKALTLYYYIKAVCSAYRKYLKLYIT